MARHGTTTVESKTGCGPDEAAEVKALRALAGMHGNPIDVVPTFLLRVPLGASDADAEQIVAELAASHPAALAGAVRGSLVGRPHGAAGDLFAVSRSARRGAGWG